MSPLGWRRRVPRPSTPDPVPPVERVVAEGLRVAGCTARMAVKNRMIVAVLRDGQDFDPVALGAVARHQLAALALENEQTADRLELRSTCPASPPRPGRYGREGEAHRRRPRVHRQIAAALRDAMRNETRIDGIVRGARDDAWREISGELRLESCCRGFEPDQDPEYRLVRDERLRGLIEVDVRALRRRLGQEIPRRPGARDNPGAS